MGDYKTSDRKKYTVYFIADTSHSFIPETQLRNFAEHFLAFAEKPTKRNVCINLSKILKSP